MVVSGDAGGSRGGVGGGNRCWRRWQQLVVAHSSRYRGSGGGWGCWWLSRWCCWWLVVRLVVLVGIGEASIKVGAE